MATSVSYIRNPDGTPGESWPAMVGCNNWCRNQGGPASEGCRNCWAKQVIENRLAGTMKGLDPKHPFRPTLVINHLGDPLRWTRRRTAFCSHMGDWLDPAIPFEHVSAIIGVGAAAHDHTILTLTKQADRLEECLLWVLAAGPGRSAHHARCCLLGSNNEEVASALATRAGGYLHRIADGHRVIAWPPRDVWIGISICDRSELPKLAAARRIAAKGWKVWVSFEPLLDDLGEPDLTGIRWIAVGCEQAPVGRRREMPIAAVRNLRSAARRAGCGFYFKQRYLDGALLHEPGLDGEACDYLPWVEAAR